MARRIDLTTEQATALTDLVSGALGGLLVEVRHTDTRTYEHELHAREKVLRSLLAQLEQAPVETVG